MTGVVLQYHNTTILTGVVLLLVETPDKMVDQDLVAWVSSTLPQIQTDRQINLTDREATFES